MLFFIFYDCNFIFLGRFSAIIFSFCCSYRSIRLLQFFVGDVILKESQRGEKILQEILYEQVHYSEQNAGKLAFVSKYDRIGGVTLPHWHDAFEITYVQKSELELTVGGKARIISEGDISYVNSGVVHSTRSVPSDRRGSGVVVLLSESMMKTACPEYEKYRFEIPEGDPGREELKRIIGAISRCKFEKPVPFSQARINALLWELCYRLCSQYLVEKNEQQISEQKEDYLARKALQYIDQNFREKLTLSSVAMEVGLQKNYFCRYFKKYVGLSYTQYLARVRLRNALAYMMDFGASVMDSAIQAGFPSARAMTICCREVYGVTPAQYRAGEAKTG